MLLMISSLEGNIVVVRVLLERSGENDNFGLSLMPNCQSSPNATAIRGSNALIQPMHIMVQIDSF
jgi:hypothetical protein